MKKIFAAMILAAAMIFISSQNNFVEAREVYVGSYSDGTAVYLLTETVSMGRPFGGGSPQFTCRVRAGRDYLNYRFFGTGHNAYNRRMKYENSEGYSGYLDDGSSPVARAIYNYVANNF